MYEAAVPVGATLITQGESVLSPEIKSMRLHFRQSIQLKLLK